ncbi:MAG: pilus assembly protein PilM [Candidatus Paceibacterota bacterium]
MFNFFTTNPCGVKISDYALEVMELSEDQVVETYGRKLLDEGMVEEGEILEKEELTEVLRKLLDDIGISTERAVLTLPSSKLTLDSFKLEEEDAKEAVLERIDESSQAFDFMKVKSGDKTYVLYVAADKDIIESYKDIIEEAGLEVVRVEPEQLALGRSLLKVDGKTRAVLNLGNDVTTLSVFTEDKELVFFKTMDFGNRDLLNKIADEEGISIKEAKHLKQKFGLNETTRENKVSPIIKEEMEDLIEEIKDEINYFETNFEKIEQVLLSGKVALTPSLSDYLAERLGKLVQMGNPLVNLKDPSYLGEEDTVHPVIFATTIGLSMSEIEDYEGKINLLFPQHAEEEEEKEIQQGMETKEEIVVEGKGPDLGKIAKGVGIVLLLLAIGVAGYFFVPDLSKPKPAPKTSNEPEQTEEEPQEEQQTEEEKEEKDEQEQEEPQQPEPKKIVTIEETPFGWLRVRKGPGTSYEELDKVDTGKSFPFVSQDGDWYEIELPYGNGWVFGGYAEVSTTTVEQ